jgi:ABC-2 type transport system ATP-binding protein
MRQGTTAPHGDRSPEPVAPAIVAEDLTKTYTFHQQKPGVLAAIRGLGRRTYETRLAVDAIGFTVQPGEVVGLLGPNGAGKTTTLKMLSGLLYPTSGRLEVKGFRPSERDVEYLRRIALVMGQKTMLWWDVPATESFLLHKEMYAIPDVDYRRDIDELATLLEVGHLLDVQVRKVSLGERMKLELMAALLHRPDIVYLDEPTIGLDVVAKARVRAFLAEINRLRGTTIVITSHDMDDIEALCRRVMIVNHGRIIYDGGLPDLVRDAQPRKLVRATFAEPVADPAALDLAGEGTTVDVRDGGRVLALEVSREALGAVLERLPRLGALFDLEVGDAEVEDIIRDLFTRSRAERAGADGEAVSLAGGVR